MQMIYIFGEMAQIRQNMTFTSYRIARFLQ
jgi:hypothetical protein